MLNKNDPLIGAVQEIMKRNQVERDAVKVVNEKFGVTDRKALPHEKQSAWDAAYKQVLSEGLHPNQQKLDVHEPEKDELTAQDFKMLRAKKKPMEEGNNPMDGDTTSPSSMGIKKPDYATGTPDYAKSKEQTVNRAAKTSLPPGVTAKTMKEEMSDEQKKAAKIKAILKHRMGKEGSESVSQSRRQDLEEKKMTDVEMAKREKIVKSMKPVSNWEKRYPGRGKEVMYATATKRAMKEENIDEYVRPLGNAVKPRLDPVSGSGGDAAKPGVAGIRGGAGVTAYDSGRQVFGQSQYGAGGKTNLQKTRPQQAQQARNAIAKLNAPSNPQVDQSTTRSLTIPNPRKPNAPGVDRGRALQAQRAAGAAGQQVNPPKPMGAGAAGQQVNPSKAAAPAAAPKAAAPAAAPKAAAPAAPKPLKTAGASTRDATLMGRAQAGGGQKLSTTFKSGGDRLAYFAARNRANK